MKRNKEGMEYYIRSLSIVHTQNRDNVLSVLCVFLAVVAMALLPRVFLLVFVIAIV